MSFRSDGRFVLEGRQDRVVKIGEKRLSLPLMEQHLGAHAYVADAALLVVEQQGEAQLWAALVLTEAGVAFETAHGRRPILAAIGDHLAGSWDRVLLPRLWRTLEQLPEDAQGKVTTGSLKRLFSDDAAAESAPRSPQILDERCSAEGIEQRCQVPEDLAQLEAHFSGTPIVPRAAQLQWAVAVARRLGAGTSPLEVVESLRFMRLLARGDVFELQVEQSGEASFTFRLHAEGEEVSSGRLRFVREAQG